MHPRPGGATRALRLRLGPRLDLPVRRRIAEVGADGCRRGEHGQASVEVLGAVPAMLALGLVILQLLAVGYSSVLAGAAAEAGALALAGGRDPKAGVRESLPGWSRARASVSIAGGTVRVRLRPPSPLTAVSRRLEVTGRASVGTP